MSLSKRSKVVLMVFIMIVISGFSIYRYAYKSHKTVDELNAKFSGTSEAFLEKVKLDTKAWQDVIVELSGKVTSKDKKGIMLNNSIYCQLDDTMSIATIDENEIIVIKGRMIGYDYLLEEIKLDQTIIKK